MENRLIRGKDKKMAFKITWGHFNKRFNRTKIKKLAKKM